MFFSEQESNKILINVKVTAFNIIVIDFKLAKEIFAIQENVFYIIVLELLFSL